MKKRRLVIVAFLICATLIAGIGYAATTETLTINGTATTSATDINVYFKSAEITTQASGGGATPGVAGAGVKSVTLTAAGLKTKDDFLVVTYVIQNDSDYPVTVAAPNISVADTTNFSVVSSCSEAFELGAKGTENSTHTFTITVTLKTTPNTIAGLSTNFTVTIGATGK